MSEEEIISYSKLQKLFRKAADLELNKTISERIIVFLKKKLNDMFYIAEEKARGEGRDYIKLSDLPLTKGFKNSMDEFMNLEEIVDVAPIEKFAKSVTAYPMDSDLIDNLGIIAGTLFVLVGRVIKLVNPLAKRPGIDEVERAIKILDLTL